MLIKNKNKNVVKFFLIVSMVFVVLVNFVLAETLIYDDSGKIIGVDNEGVENDIKYFYSDGGDVETIDVGDGEEIYNYDSKGNLLSEQYLSNPDKNVYFTYHSDWSLKSKEKYNEISVYDQEGRLVEFKTPTKETIFEYDSDGNLLFGRKKNLLTGNIESSLEYEYDNGILISGNVFVGGQNYIYERPKEYLKLTCENKAGKQYVTKCLDNLEVRCKKRGYEEINREKCTPIKMVCERVIRKKWRRDELKALTACKKLGILRIEDRIKTTLLGRKRPQYRAVCQKLKTTKCEVKKCPRGYKKFEGREIGCDEEFIPKNFYSPFVDSKFKGEYLSSYWNMDESSGIRKDLVGDNDLTDKGVKVYSEGWTYSDFEIDSQPGIMGNAAQFNDESFEAINEFPHEGTFAVSLWVYADLYSSHQLVVKDKFYRLFFQDFNGVNVLVFDVIQSSDRSHKFIRLHDSDGQKVPIDKWNHIVGIVDGSQMFLYVNNEEVTFPEELSSYEGSLFNEPGKLFVGDNNAFQGAIDEFGLWKDITFENEEDRQAFVANLYNEGKGVTYTAEGWK